VPQLALPALQLAGPATVTPAPALHVTPVAAVCPVLPTVQVTVAAAVVGVDVEHDVSVIVGVVLTVIEYA
jgi:hypothetical protein